MLRTEKRSTEIHPGSGKEIAACVTRAAAQDGSRLIEIPAQIHPLHGNSIVILYPGRGGSIDGYNGKYRSLSGFIVEQGLGAVVRIGNSRHESLPYSISVIDDLDAVVSYALSNAESICGSTTPRIFLMGISAGAGAAAAVASSYAQVSRLLLVAPSVDADEERIRCGLSSFRGEVYAVVGEDDETVGADAAEYFCRQATSAARSVAHVIPQCDHQFRGERNGRILSSLPSWAFGNQLPQPSAEAGIKLYD